VTSYEHCGRADGPASIATNFRRRREKINACPIPARPGAHLAALPAIRPEDACFLNAE
jgi:hypothetical protein